MKEMFLMLSFIWTTTVYAAPIKWSAIKGSQIKFVAIGKPAFLKIVGESGLSENNSGPTGSLELSENNILGHFEFNLSHLDTGIELRNEHMRENYLEVAKYPSAKLSIDRLSVAPTEAITGANGIFHGQLTLHGKTRPVSGKFLSNAQKDTVSVTADFTILLSEFGIEIPKYAGITVSETVNVTAKINLGPVK